LTTGCDLELQSVTRRSPVVPVDFRAARRQVERLEQVRSEMRHRAFSIWVGLFDLATVVDGEFLIERSARGIVEDLRVSRQAWYEYRDVLEVAGLLRVGPHRGPRPQSLTLVPPQG
jgi:hypothetical protein